MEKKIFRPLAVLFCAVCAMFVFSSFTAAQPRGGGDDEVTYLQYDLSAGNHVIPLEQVSDYVLGDLIQGGGPYWVSLGESDNGQLALHVQANPDEHSRSTVFEFTVYTASAKYCFQVSISQEGRSRQ